MREMVERGGLRVATDVGTAEQAAQIGAGVGDNDLARISRILVAHTA